MKDTLETRLGIFFALALIAAVFINEMVGGVEFFKRGYHLRAHFQNVLDLKKGDPVKMAGVQVGRVDKIGFADNLVEVTMKINRDAVVRTDSKATIKFLGLLGQNYIALDFGTTNGVPAQEGATLSTAEQADLSALMAKLDSVAAGVDGMAKNLGGIKIGDLFAVAKDVLDENRGYLHNTMTNIQTITARIAEGKGTVGRLLTDETLYSSALGAVTNLSDTAGEVKGIITEAKSIVGDIKAGQGTIGLLAKDPKLYNETAEAMTNLKAILAKINRGTGSVARLVNDDTMFKNVRMTLQKLDKATESLEDQGPLSIIGVAAGSLF